MNSEQLSLDLGMPWDGVSPRYLTKAPKKLSLASEGTGRSIRRPFTSIQLELFPEETSYGTSRFYTGAHPRST